MRDRLRRRRPAGDRRRAAGGGGHDHRDRPWSRTKLEPALRRGATHAVDAVATPTRSSRCIALTGGGVDHAFEVVGSARHDPPGLGRARPGRDRDRGRRRARAASRCRCPRSSSCSEKTITGSYYGSADVHAGDAPSWPELVADGRLDLAEVGLGPDRAGRRRGGAGATAPGGGSALGDRDRRSSWRERHDERRDDLDGRIAEGWGGGAGANGSHVNVVLGRARDADRRGDAGHVHHARARATPRSWSWSARTRPSYEPVWPPTIMINKATATEDRHQTITWGAAQLGIAQGVLDAVADELIRADRRRARVRVRSTIDPGARTDGDPQGQPRARDAQGDRRRASTGATPRPRGRWWSAATTSPARSTGASSGVVKITAIRLQRLRLPLDPPFYAAWDPVPRTRVRGHDRPRRRPTRAWRGSAAATRWPALTSSSTCSSAGTRWRSPATPARWRRSRFTPGATGRSRRRCGTCSVSAVGLPVGALLGGAADRLPAYASWGELRPPAQRAEDAGALVEQGFRAVKVRIARDRIDEGVGGGGGGARRGRRRGSSIIVDLNQWWRMPGDIERGLGRQTRGASIERLAEHGVLWVEEPLAGEDRAGCGCCAQQHRRADRAAARWRERSTSCGRALDADALDVFQPDVVLALGISGARTLAELALRRNRWFTPHTWTNGIGAAGQPARLRGRRRRAVPRVPLRPARLDARAARLHARLAGGDRRRRLPVACPTRPGWGSCSTRRRWRSTRVDGDAARPVDPDRARRLRRARATWAARCAGTWSRPASRCTAFDLDRRPRWPAPSPPAPAPPLPRPTAPTAPRC